MKHTATKLTAEERDVIVLTVQHGQPYSNSEIAQRIGIPVSRVKTLIHKACLKLGAHNRNEAIFFAMRRGEISINEVYSHEEQAEILSSLGPDVLKRIAHLLRQETEHGHLPGADEQIICADRRQGTTLTKRERDVLILASRGLTNKEIAARLCITNGTVKTFLNRVCTKLGARKRADAVALALKQREITICDIASLNEVLRCLAPLGAESIENMALLLDQKPGQQPILAAS